MTSLNEGTAREPVPVRSLLAFLAIAFGLTWGILGLYLAFPEAMAGRFGALTGRHPLFVLCTWAPAIAAVAVVLGRAGVVGFRRLLSRLTLWRCSAGWWAFLVLGIPAIYALGSAVKGNLLDDPFPFEGPGAMLGAMAFMLMLGPVEEIGWRGLALPLLQRRMAPFWAALVLGLIWGVWHLPAFFLAGTPQGGWSFMPFFVGAVSLSLIVTPLFNASGGSILLAALFHWQLVNPLWPDAQPHDIPLFAAAAAATVWLHRDTMFAGGGATEVVPDRSWRTQDSPSAVA